MENSKENNNVIVTSCANLDIDSLISTQAYAHFLKNQGFNVKHIQHLELDQIQKEIFNLCKTPLPKIFNEFSIHNEDIILVNPYTIDSLDKLITPENVIGIMGKKTPKYYDILHSKNIHFEDVNSFSTLITEKFMHTQTPIDFNTASLLLIGIILTLNGLEESVTTNRDFVAVEYLQKHSNLNQQHITNLMGKLKI